jgi:16S rRNA (cytidine1402-2'-O)-methyltransferase
VSEGAGSPGVLFLVGTPIGNLEDLSARAVRVLGEVDIVAAEDTRQARKLLSHLGLRKPLLSYHQHSKQERASELLKRLQGGQNVALVSDAGMPGVSDPGVALVAEAIALGISVTPVPGPAALVMALAGSGLPTASFVFDGFLPRKPGPRRRRLEDLALIGVTVVIYESPYRVVATLRDVAAVMEDPEVSVGRELTKRHEEFLRGRASEVAGCLEAREIQGGRLLGEFTVVIAGGGRRRSRRGRPGKSEPVRV